MTQKKYTDNYNFLLFYFCCYKLIMYICDVKINIKSL